MKRCKKCGKEIERTYEKELYYVGDSSGEQLVRTVYKYISTCYECGERQVEVQDSARNKDD